MWALFQKEVSGFFSTITGYVVLGVFLLINGMLLWIFPWNFNILDGGYASMSPFFALAPWILLFLIPAVTMRSFSQEKKDGTLELLLTRPITTLNIVVSKYLASLFLVFVALLLTLPYYFSIVLLGDPTGNIDHGAVWGSYTGLFLLAASFAAIGVFTSTITDNTIASFILGIFLCAWMYAAFSFVANLFPLGGLGNIIIGLGMEEHFQSLSRGVIDSRDLAYFVTIIVIFIAFSNLKLKSKR